METIRATLPPGFGELAMTRYPHDRDWVLAVREAVDAAIGAARK